METQDDLSPDEARDALAQALADAGWSLAGHTLDERPGEVSAPWGKHAGHYAYTVKTQRCAYSGTYSAGSALIERWAREHVCALPPEHRWAFKGRGSPNTSAYGTGSPSIDGAAALDAARMLWAPSLMDVVSCLLLDGDGMVSRPTFRGWLQEGTAPENAADALDVYNALQDVDRFLTRALDASTRERWTEYAHSM